ncbi:HIT family protein [Candidatus Nanohalococcus occultus]|uniref:HIT family protein n=1 Tax=Candidatus Nanohalococcus occultus TaxID=2978047 RepID=UPI0039DFCCBA
MPQQGGQCPFCQLIQNPDQLMLVGESENFYAWLEVNPRAKGHSMIVPKEHKENVLEFSSEEWTEAFNLTREVVEKAKKGIGADGASITVNIEEAGGQMLPHAYIQVFPRFQGEETAGTPTGAIFPQRDELQQQLDSIASDMNSASVDIGGGEEIEAHPESQRFKDPEPEPEPDDSEDEEQEAEEPEPEQKVVEKEIEVKDAGELSEDELVQELINRHGSREGFVSSETFEQIISGTGFSLKKSSNYEKKSFDWI